MPKGASLQNIVRTGVLLLAILSLAGVEQGYTQVAGGTISGTVSDSSGRVIPSANVVVKNVATGITRETTTNTDGLYTAPNLVPGSYDVTFKASGFRTEIRTGIPLTVGAT